MKPREHNVSFSVCECGGHGWYCIMSTKGTVGYRGADFDSRVSAKLAASAMLRLKLISKRQCRWLMGLVALSTLPKTEPENGALAEMIETWHAYMLKRNRFIPAMQSPTGNEEFHALFDDRTLLTDSEARMRGRSPISIPRCS